MRVQKNIFTMAFVRNAVLSLLLLLSSWTLRAQYDTDAVAAPAAVFMDAQGAV